jgi:hypothetical protein
LFIYFPVIKDLCKKLKSSSNIQFFNTCFAILSWYQSNNRPSPLLILISFYPYSQMASSSAAPVPMLQLPNLSQNNGFKLDDSNYLLWLSQVVPILKSHELMGIVDGSEPCPPTTLTDAEGKEVQNPDFSAWNRRDQLLLSWINMSLTESVLSTVFGLHTSKQVWTALANRFASQLRYRISHLKR